MRVVVFVSFVLAGCIENPGFILDDQTFGELSEDDAQSLCDASLYGSCTHRGGVIRDRDACLRWLSVLKDEAPNEVVRPKYDCWQSSLCDSDASCDIGCEVMPKDDCQSFGCQTEIGTPYNASRDCFDDQQSEPLYCFGNVGESICPQVFSVVFSPEGELYVGSFCGLRPGWFSGNRRWSLCEDLDEVE